MMVTGITLFYYLPDAKVINRGNALISLSRRIMLS